MSWELFLTFMTIGFLSFGGGYAMIPVIGHAVNVNGWMSERDFTDVIAVAGMSPGPIATNSAIFVGYHVNGIAGAIAATAGITLPSLILVILVAAFFYKMHENEWVQSAFYGLRAIVTGLILYGAIKFGLSNGLFGLHATSFTAISLAIFACALFALWRLKIHPIQVILLSGLIGVAIFG